MKNFDDFIALVNSQDAKDLILNNKTQNYIKDSKDMAELIANALIESDQRTLNILRCYHEWVNRT